MNTLHPHTTGCLVHPDTGVVLDAGIIIFDPTRGVVVHHGVGQTDVVYPAAAYPRLCVLPAPAPCLN